MAQHKTILIAPLDWGLGHASRCIPVIHKYLQEGNNVIIAGTHETNKFISTEFPNLEYLTIPGYRIQFDFFIKTKENTQHYANFSDYQYAFNPKKSQLPVIIKQIPKILRAIRKEHLWLKNLLKSRSIDLIISDNRYGLWHRQVKSIFITHQLFLKTPFRFIDFHWVIRYLIRHFDEVWIPDFQATPNLSGDLSHKRLLPQNRFKFIGPLSRFSLLKKPTEIPLQYDYMAIASGPSAQRRLFIYNITALAKLNKQQKGVLLMGDVCKGPQLTTYVTPTDNLEIFPHLPAKEFIRKIMASKKIIAASGYSTIMDLYVLGKLHTADLRPIKGQTEQEYLFSHWKKHFAEK